MFHKYIERLRSVVLGTLHGRLGLQASHDAERAQWARERASLQDTLSASRTQMDGLIKASHVAEKILEDKVNMNLPSSCNFRTQSHSFFIFEFLALTA